MTARKAHGLMELFEVLHSAYGPQGWWPGDSPFEIIVGAVLTQSTAWHNVALAIENLKAEGLLDVEVLLRADPEIVKALLGPAGFFNVKYERLMNLLEYLDVHGVDNERFRRLPVADLREELLAVRGIGHETADSILLYAFDRPVFVVDAYTRRLFSRLGYGWMEKAPYERVRRFFTEELPSDTGLFGEFHALVVVHCKTTCKKSPRCAACCLSPRCSRSLGPAPG
jgi:endonuclease-3 related protein